MKTGMVITFTEEVTMKQVRKLVAIINESDEIDFPKLTVDTVDVREFNPEFGSPVWYVP